MIRALILSAFVCSGLIAIAISPPVITRHPTSVTVGAGVPVQFVASVSDATSYSYQWFHGDSPVENATNTTLVLTDTTFASAGEYRLRASNDSVSVESSAATLTILPPVQLRHVASVLTPGGGQKNPAMWVRVIDDLAYVADSQLQIYDVSDPSNPIHLSSFGTNSSIYGFFVTNNVAYALAGSYFEAIDVSNPREPARLSRTNLNITLTDINVNGNYAYISALQGFRVFDVSNPARMVEVGKNNSYPGFTLARVGDVVYIGGTDLGVPVMDVSNPALPLRTNILRPGFVDTVKITGNRLYTAGSVFAVYDIRDPKFPKVLAPARPAALSATQGMSARGDFMFTGNRSGMINARPFFSVFDLHNPSLYLELARITFTNNVWVESVDLVDKHIYMTVGRNLEIYERERSTNMPVLMRGIGDVRVASGAPARLEAFATGGEELSYQWFHNTAEPYEIEGATNRALQFTQAAPTHTGSYSVRISNSHGSITNTGTLQLTSREAFSPTISLGDARGQRLTLTLLEGVQVRVEASSDLVTWEEFAAFQSDGTATNIFDLGGRFMPKRFYRLQYGLE